MTSSKRSSRTLSPKTPNTASLLAVLAGTGWLAYAAVQVSGPDYWRPVTVIDHAAVLLYSLSLLICAAAFVALAGAARPQIGGRGLAAARLGAVGAVVAGVANVGEDSFGIAVLGYPFMFGMLVFGVGGLAFGLTLALSARWRALALLPPLTFCVLPFGGVGGPLVVGAAWIAGGIVLGRGRGAG
jgi:hypothetical protein